MVQAVHKPRTIGRALHAQGTTASHKVLFLVMGTRPRDVEAHWIASHPSHTGSALSSQLNPRPLSGKYSREVIDEPSSNYVKVSSDINLKLQFLDVPTPQP